MDYKERRKLSYLINTFDDIGLDYIYIKQSKEDLIKLIIKFFNTESLLIYPAKSYFVAIVYAKCLEKYFDKDFYQALDDEELLPDDKYFLPYSKSKYIYDQILTQLQDDILSYKHTEKTVQYFKKEFLVCN